MRTLDKTVEFLGQECIIQEFKYVDANQKTLRLTVKATGEPMAMATACIPEADAILEENEVIIKNYSENEGILDALIDAGIIQYVNKDIPSGFVTCPVCKLLV